MKITTVSAAVRYSKRLDNGGHKTVELSADAILAPRESWREAQAKLYAEVGRQMVALWTIKVNGQNANGAGTPEPTTDHRCQEHGVPFQRHEKDGRVWSSHKLDGGKWCSEK